jgi:manganese transport protein
MVPALIVLAVSHNVTSALVWSQVVLAVGIPFALGPLLWLSRDRHLMGSAVNRRRTTAAMGVTTAVVSGLSAWLLVATV